MLGFESLQPSGLHIVFWLPPLQAYLSPRSSGYIHQLHDLHMHPFIKLVITEPQIRIRRKDRKFVEYFPVPSFSPHKLHDSMVAPKAAACAPAPYSVQGLFLPVNAGLSQVTLVNRMLASVTQAETQKVTWASPFMV